MTYEKPPLGVAPHWYVYPKRLKELNEAIERYLEFAENFRQGCLTGTYTQIARWSEELKVLAELESEMQRREQQ